MNEIKPTIGFEFEDRYKEAKRKMFDFKEAFDALSPVEKERFVNEVMSTVGVATSLDQFIKFYMQHNGQ